MAREAGESAKYWEGILYQENMIENWKDEICRKIQRPFVYCEHSKDKMVKEGERKNHLHLIIAWDAPTTKSWALYVMNTLSKQGETCCPVIEPCRDIRNCYDYLIHDTEDARKKGKYQYLPEDRVEGNGFDIGCYEQISSTDKIVMSIEIQNFIYEHDITDYFELCVLVAELLGVKYYQIIKETSGHFGKLVNGYWQYRQKHDREEAWNKFSKFVEKKDNTPN